MMVILTNTPRVSVILDDRYGDTTIAEATLLGYPSRHEGKPVAVEVQLDTGRNTLVEMQRVVALNVAAEVLLAHDPERAVAA